MNGFAAVFLFISVVALFTLPRRWVLLPMLTGACYMTNAQSINVGPFHFTVLRLLLLVGFIRAVIKSERIAGKLNTMDRIVVVWGLWMIFASVFHKPFGEQLVYHLGFVYNVVGLYFFIRIYCESTEDLIQIIKITALILVPVAFEMINEKLTGRNFFGFLGGVPLETVMRDGKLRAQGPFGHPILAGTVGGLCIPFMIGIWSRHRLTATIGLCACLAIVLASASSGPLMTMVISVAGLAFWRWRRFTGHVRVAAVILYILCDMLMTRPAYYLLEKVDLTGSSTGYHRAAIIDAGITHLDEWWLGGTDYTRHWMPYGVSWSEDHVDITNHYLFYGTIGGLLPVLLFFAQIWIGFRWIGQSLRLHQDDPFSDRFLIWSIGAGLFAHAGTMISVAYFDQSIMFLYLNLAVIATMHTNTISESALRSNAQ
jgi:hypothetical protein